MGVATGPQPRAPDEAGGIPLVDQLRMLREAFSCPNCGKTTAIVNVAGHRAAFRAEHISPETHCLCEGSPVLADYQRQQERGR